MSRPKSIHRARALSRLASDGASTPAERAAAARRLAQLCEAEGLTVEDLRDEVKVTATIAAPPPSRTLALIAAVSLIDACLLLAEVGGRTPSVRDWMSRRSVEALAKAIADRPELLSSTLTQAPPVYIGDPLRIRGPRRLIDIALRIAVQLERHPARVVNEATADLAVIVTAARHRARQIRATPRWLLGGESHHRPRPPTRRRRRDADRERRRHRRHCRRGRGTRRGTGTRRAIGEGWTATGN